MHESVDLVASASKASIRNRVKTLAYGRRVDDPRVYEESGQNKKEGDKNQTGAALGGQKEKGGERSGECANAALSTAGVR